MNMGVGTREPPRRRIAAGLLAGTALAAMPAAAQETGAEDEDTAIVVTANLRSENLQDVAISLQALGETTLAEHNVASFDDYAKMLPSVSFQSFGPGSSQLNFRGITSGGDGLDAGSLPATGVYLDDVPVTTIGYAVDLHVYDVARVEALSGPQGTLYGASSLSGTLRIITNKPDTSGFYGGVDGQLNKFGDGEAGGEIEGFLNIPLAANAALRLVGYYTKDGGYIDNTYGERTFTLDDGDDSTNLTVNNAGFVEEDFNDAETYGGRVALEVDLDENWTVRPSAMYQHLESNGGFLFDPPRGLCKASDECHGPSTQPPPPPNINTTEGPQQARPPVPGRKACKKGKVRRKGKCVRRKHHKRHHRKHGKKRRATPSAAGRADR